MADQIRLILEPRRVLGKKVKQLRRAGFTPVHLYGPGIDSQSLQCSNRELLTILTRAGRNTPIAISVEGSDDENLALVRDIHWEPVRGDLLHVDFLRVDVAQRISAEVPLTLVGESEGAREARGAVVQRLYSLQIEALPLSIPQEMQVDVSLLNEPESVIRARDIELPADVTLLTDPETMVAGIDVARGQVGEVEDTEETGGEEIQESAVSEEANSQEEN